MGNALGCIREEVRGCFGGAFFFFFFFFDGDDDDDDDDDGSVDNG
jgi:hypothetical protein